MGTGDLKLKREASITFAAKMLMGLFGFSGVIIFARVLSLTGLGQYYFGLAVSILLASISSGVGTAVKKRSSESESNPDSLLAIGFLGHILVGLIGGILLIISFPILESRLGSSESVYYVFGLFITLGAFYITKNSYEGRGFPSKGVWFDAFETCISMLFQLCFLWLNYGVEGLFAGKIIGNSLSIAVILIVTETSISKTTIEDASDVRSFAVWSIPNKIFENLLTRIDIILITVFIGAPSAGIYEAAKRLTFPGVMASNSISEPLLVKISGLSSLGKNEEVLNSLKQSVGYAGIVSIPIVFGGLVVGEQLMIQFFGPEFGNAELILFGIAFAQLFNSYRGPFCSMINGSNRPFDNVKANCIAVTCNIVGSVILIQFWGTFGVVVATIIAEFARFVYYETLIYKNTNSIIVPTVLKTQYISGIIMGVSLFEFTNFIQVNTLYEVITITFIGGLIYALFLLPDSRIRETLVNFSPSR